MSLSTVRQRNNRTVVTVTVTVVATATATATVASIWIYKSIKRYGLEGTLRYVWEGDPYPPTVRHVMTKLDTIDNRCNEQQLTIELLQTSFQRAQLDTIDNDNTNDIDNDVMLLPQWIVAHGPRNVGKDLAHVSYELDVLAASVDNDICVRPTQQQQHDYYANVIKRRKRTCSQRIVGMMEQVDALLGVFQQQQRQSETEE